MPAIRTTEAFSASLPSGMMFRSALVNADGHFDCGNGGAYQVQVQQALNSRMVLLRPSTPEDAGHDAGLSALAEEMNDYFQARAMAQLLLKRKELTLKGRKAAADRLEVTVVLTEKGLQLAYSQALPRKECAPMPRKSLTRRLLGPLYPGRRFWVMPEHEEGYEEPEGKPAESKPSPKKGSPKRATVTVGKRA